MEWMNRALPTYRTTPSIPIRGGQPFQTGSGKCRMTLIFPDNITRTIYLRQRFAPILPLKQLFSRDFLAVPLLDNSCLSDQYLLTVAKACGRTVQKSGLIRVVEMVARTRSREHENQSKKKLQPSTKKIFQDSLRHGEFIQ